MGKNRNRGGLNNRALRGLTAIALSSVLVISGCGSKSEDATGAAGASGGDGQIDLVAYSTPQEAYENVLQPAFQETAAGEGVTFTNSFAASGDSRRAVEAGQPADFVNFALETDMTPLVEQGIVAEDWKDNRYKGIVHNSVVAIVTRPGNPENVRSFQDIVDKKLDVVTANPALSGGARWSILAVWGSVTSRGGSDEEAREFTKQLLSQAVVQPTSARDALQAFVSGEGDVLLSYENEAFAALNAGQDIEYLIPDDTILIEQPAAVTVDAGPEAEAWLDWLWSDEAQKLWSEAGYRPVNPDLLDEERFPTPKNLFTVDSEFDGWANAKTRFFEEGTGIIMKIEEELGVQTSR